MLKDTSEAPCSVASNMYLTLHLLLFRQSMRVLIAIGLMYLILLQGKIYTNENQSNEMLGLCFVLK